MNPLPVTTVNDVIVGECRFGMVGLTVELWAIPPSTWSPGRADRFKLFVLGDVGMDFGEVVVGDRNLPIGRLRKVLDHPPREVVRYMLDLSAVSLRMFVRELKEAAPCGS